MKALQVTCEIQVVSYNELNELEKQLIEKAKKSTLKAYAVYSNFHVGCAVLLDNGKIFTANNQENASYPAGICAERLALMYANANYPDVSVHSVYIAAYTNKSFTKRPISPCGICRQVLLECENRFKKPIRLFLYGEECIYIINSVKDMLPISFDDQQLIQ